MILLLLSALVHAVLASASRSSKRGLIYIADSSHPTDVDDFLSKSSDLTWYYNYGPEPSPPLSNTSLQFVPMLWGTSDNNGANSFLDSVKSQITSGSKIQYVLGFNEPDGSKDTGGSNVSPGDAASTWQSQIEPLHKLGVQLGAPAVTGSPDGLKWLKSFFSACNGKCTTDFIPVHWYGDFEGLASYVGQVGAAYPGKEIWVTEYADPNANLSDSQTFYNQSVGWFDRMENITHYSYFGSFRSSASNVGPNAAMLDQDGDLTDIGSWYLGGNATGNIPNGTAAGLRAFGFWLLLVLVTALWTTI
ncbi:hypothetical protein NA57DRAFT_73401 [Rhizodiscina lignyota]|uniref:Asl1-like glycosyl hydrolase catalytic domain-containing protein n=1 Tax=Rhizodiscina lignyota TaxID=1504668 RepID=A0A9P4ILJ3_9PEZI|nr:hypothetical protein NA57DRAFT_73401 [Rhizodiscina lignyota]